MRYFPDLTVRFAGPAKVEMIGVCMRGDVQLLWFANDRQVDVYAHSAVSRAFYRLHRSSIEIASISLELTHDPDDLYPRRQGVNIFAYFRLCSISSPCEPTVVFFAPCGRLASFRNNIIIG